MAPSLQLLPLEVIGNVASHLQVIDLRSAASTSRRLNDGVSAMLFHSVGFSGDRQTLKLKFLEFLQVDASGRADVIIRAARTVSIRVVENGLLTGYREEAAFLPALMVSVLQKLTRAQCLIIDIDGLTFSEHSAFDVQVRRAVGLPLYRHLVSGRIQSPYDRVSRKLADNLTSVKITQIARDRDISLLVETCPDLRRLALTVEDPIFDYRMFLPQGNKPPRLNVVGLENLEWLVLNNKINLRYRRVEDPESFLEAIQNYAHLAEGTDEHGDLQDMFSDAVGVMAAEIDTLLDGCIVEGDTALRRTYRGLQEEATEFNIHIGTILDTPSDTFPRGLMH
ncbi:hypothetical protein NW752_005957 [Fusarium irregulare]|uniref:F-box domain-containing protein n=1 Tax=Fusarium irregulare TaxID=2494466 RepID=A0A9W8PQD6_9HYPO|nr:hypothetical protein NW766_006491 [Fusarium irregulare]KAJ4018829.1 hypothetical protein NW752_005957 [Fusarium irregulare]